MEIYFVILIVCLFCAFFDKDSKYGIIPLFLIFCVTAFRDASVGTDTYNYLNNTNRVLLYDKSFSVSSLSSLHMNQIEIISNGMYAIISQLKFSSFRLAVVVYAFINCLILFLISKKENINLSKLVYFFYVGGLFIYSLNICRQVAAVMILVYACMFIYEKLFKKSLLFFVFVFLATGIHASSIFFVFLYLFRFISISYKKNLLIACPLILLFLLDVLSIKNIMNNMNYYSYADIYGRVFLKESDEKSLFGFAVLFVTLGIKFFCLNKISDCKKAFFTFAIFVTTVSSSLDSIARRSLLLFSGIIFVFYSFVYNEKNNDFRYYSFYVVVPLLSYAFIKSVAGNSQIVPYAFCF